MDVGDWPSGTLTPLGVQPTNLLPGQVQSWPSGIRSGGAEATVLSQAVAWWDASRYRDGDRWLRNQGIAGELLDLRLGSSTVANSNDPSWLGPDSTGYVYLPGVNGNALSVPDEVALDITGDIDLRVLLSLDDWTPSGIAAPLSKYASGSLSYEINVNTNGTLLLRWSPDNSTALTATSTASVSIADGSPTWIRATLDVNNGAGTPQYEVKFWTSPPSDGSNWTQLGSTVTGNTGATSIFAGTTALVVGARGVSGSLFSTGKFYRAQVLNGIDGTTVLDVDCDAITRTQVTSFTAITGQTVTINYAASGLKTVAMPGTNKIGSWSRRLPCFLFGTDDYMEIPAERVSQHNLLNFRSGQSMTVLLAAGFPSFTASQIFLAKRQGTAASVPGYIISNASGTASIANWTTADTAQNSVAANAGRAYSTNLILQFGVREVLSGSRVRMTSNFIVPVESATNANRSIIIAGQPPPAASATGFSNDLVNALTFRIGRGSGAGTSYGDMQFYGAAIWNRPLTLTEMRSVLAWYVPESSKWSVTYS